MPEYRIIIGRAQQALLYPLYIPGEYHIWVDPHKIHHRRGNNREGEENS
jgi:hypothetical protein